MSNQRRHTADRELDPGPTDRPGGRLCEWPECTRLGEYRAPKSREHLRSFRYFCLEHVREYNRRWDFFSGMNQAEIEAYLREDVTWHRPTWPLGNGPQQHARNWRWQDPFEVLINGAGMNGKANASEWDRPAPRLGKTERMLAVMNLGPEATPKEVKARYKELVKLHHPDLHGGDKRSEERLKLINEAYTYLRGSDRYA